MSTKNLARTAIEGGRTGYYKSEVQDHASSERAAGRVYLRLVARDPEAADAVIDPKRRPVFVSFHDKLSPVYAFLDSRIGKSWNKTFAEISTKFDLRTTPGRHVTNDHMLSVIAFKGEHQLVRRGGFTPYYRYFVDQHGILRKNVRQSRVHNSPTPPFDSKRLVAWLGARKIGQQGERFVWWLPVSKAARCGAIWEMTGIKYVELDENGDAVLSTNLPRSGFGWEPSVVAHTYTGSYRPAGLLKGDDDAYFRSLPEHARQNVLQAAPSAARGTLASTQSSPCRRSSSIS